MTEFEKALLSQLVRIAKTLEGMQDSVRRVAEPTEAEIRERVQRTLAMATLLSSSRDESDALN